MERVEIKGESITYKWKAADGTEFKDQEQCRKYEETAACVLGSRVTVKKANFTDIFYFGCGDEEMEFVSGNPVDVAMYIKYHDIDGEVSKETLKRITESNDTWIVYYNCDGTLCFVEPLTQLIEKIKATATPNK